MLMLRQKKHIQMPPTQSFKIKSFFYLCQLQFLLEIGYLPRLLSSPVNSWIYQNALISVKCLGNFLWVLRWQGKAFNFQQSWKFTTWFCNLSSVQENVKFCTSQNIPYNVNQLLLLQSQLYLPDIVKIYLSMLQTMKTVNKMK